jgi:hypothetical protein
MARHDVRQQRSGEGALLLQVDPLGPEQLPELAPALLEGVLLVWCRESIALPNGADEVAPQLWALRGSQILEFFQAAHRWAAHGAIFGLLDEVPDVETRTRCIAHSERPWDHERLGLQVYGQVGRGLACQGIWFADEELRRRWLEMAVAHWIAPSGCELPNGDACLVFGFPFDGTWATRFHSKGKGAEFRLTCSDPARGKSREWRIERNEWKGAEHPLVRSPGHGLWRSFSQYLASALIFLLSLPVAVLLGVVMMSTKMTASSGTSKRVDHRPRSA